MAAYHERQLDALGNAVRRAILVRLAAGPLAVGELSTHFPMSRPAISQHLRILKEARLVTCTAAGTRSLYAIDPDGFNELRRFFDQLWGSALWSFKSKIERNEAMTIDADGSVRQSVTVAAPPHRAFHVFTADFDSWWPRTHHIGKSPMTKAIIEGRVGGRCYSQQEDGTACPWGQVLVWEPPHRLVIAWQITAQWGFEPDLAHASEVEVRFVDAGGGQTRVELEHRSFERMGPDGATMRTAVSAEGGWGTLMNLFAARVKVATAGQGAITQ